MGKRAGQEDVQQREQAGHAAANMDERMTSTPRIDHGEPSATTLQGPSPGREFEPGTDGDELNSALVQSFGQKIMTTRPTTAFLREADDKLPYPELFDRSERTFAATFAKFGDLSYFTPVQRIGVYMDYS